MFATGSPPSVHTDNVTLIDSVRPLVSASCSELVLIDWNYTGPGDGVSPVGRTEAKPNESMAHMSAMGHVANIHNTNIGHLALDWVVLYAHDRGVIHAMVY